MTRLAFFTIGCLCLVVNSAAALEKTASLLNGQRVGELAVAGRLSVDLHSVFMVSRTYERDTVLNWYNCGYSGGGQATTVGGNFGDFGFQVPWQQRDGKYPHAVSVNNVPSVRFNGGNVLKSNFAVEKHVAGARKMALEVWLRAVNPSPNQVLLGWQSKDGREVSAALKYPAQFNGSDQWRYLVVNCTPTIEDWYLDGVKVSSGRRRTIIKDGHVMVLGGASAAAPSFRGDLAAVRLHDDALTEEAIAHNFKGGVMLGTEMHNWWRLEPDKWFVVESEHFRHCVDKVEMAKWSVKQRKEFDERVPGMFHLAELVYHTYSERLALRSSVVSRRPEKRGDGIKYKIPIQPTDGGNFMGVDDDFGWSCQYAGFINPHELVHGFDVMTGNMQGNFWETHANFPQTYNGIYQTIPVVISECPAFPSSGRTYYHDRLMFEHLSQTPEYGPMFIAKLWHDGPTEAEESPYPWQTFARLNPPTSLGCEYTRMVQKMVTWDYTTFAEAPAGKGNTTHGNDGVPRRENLYRKVAQDNAADIRRYARIVLDPIPYEPGWWRVPKEQAPQQLGWNICPLKFQAGKVTATLAGYVNKVRGSDWRAGFVGVDNDGKPVYGDVFGLGKPQTFEAGANLKELYLVVCAVPANIMAINMTGDFRSFDQEQFPYKVKFIGCVPFNPMVPEPPTEAGAPHPNGGGFVAASAKVAPAAYVGPNTRILGISKVLGKARIEDFAVVRNATVKDEAVVSGHALVHEDSVVSGRAKVRDYAVVKAHSTLTGNARILEHATLASQKTCGDGVVVKGVANVYGGNQSGTAMIDGFYAKGNEITKGKWFTWSWGQGKNSGEVDDEFGGVYADYDFATGHPWMAVDAFGVTWGYLVGAPQFAACPDKEVRKNSLRQPEVVLPKLDQEQNDDKNYSQLLTTYLCPTETGDYTFWISADDEGELWIGNAGSDQADRKLCGNPFWAGFHDYNRFPAQKSASVHLERGRAYPVKVLHGNVHMGGSLSVSWAKSGTNKSEPIPNECLSLTADGRRPGVRQRIWGDVHSVADLVKRRDFPDGCVRVGGAALALNGKDQFVELPKDVADMRASAYTVEFKCTGRGDGARLFEFANPNGDAIWLSPWEDGKLVFAIRQGAKVEYLTTQGVQPGLWTIVRIVMDGNNAALFIDGKKAAENTAAKLSPESVHATQCYLGRGYTGGYFGGLISRFTIHSQGGTASK